MVAQQDVTGTPRWQLAREIIAQLREMPAATAESEIESRLRNVLGFLFPNLGYPDIATQYPSGDGPIDVYCRNVVFETKGPGKLDARRKRDGATETPEEQAVRYLDALSAQPNMFADTAIGWRAGVTDGKEWLFYEYDRHAPDAEKLALANSLRLDTPADDDTLLAYLYAFVNRTAKMAPPTDNVAWVERQLEPFLILATRYENTAAYGVKRDLWRGVLSGAFINPPGDAERELFARHTMLVVVARAVAETLRPPGQQAAGADALHDTLAEGFAAWLLDAAGDDGAVALDNFIAEVGNYEWRTGNRDTLKDLYHAVIPRNIRHDFGEYYTPDWLARAVCEEVMDAKWRKATIAMAVAGQLNGPAVLDPSCGSGTFLFHATRLLLEDARQHPELANSPQAQVEIVNDLVAGIDLHPVAVELAKTTKMLALYSSGQLAADIHGFANVYLGDSLQWETRRNEELFNRGNLVDIPADDPAGPLQLPRSMLRSEHFTGRLNQMFDYAEREEYPGIENDLAAALGLANAAEQEAAIAAYRRFRDYIETERNHVWRWYISNMVQPIRLAQQPASRLVGNPPWVVYNAMASDRQDVFRQHSSDRNLWAGANLATQNDLAATFVATCVDYYLQTGGKFGFVLPYAALRGRHWANFRTGDWSLQQDAERSAHIDLSKEAWDFYGVNAPPFPQANSSVVFGTKVAANRQRPRLKPLDGIREATGSGITTRMAWDEVKPRLTFTRRREWPVAPSPAYAEAFRNGATLFPQPLAVFERPDSRALGRVYFKTNTGKGKWRGKERAGQVEERFVKPALFSRMLLPFGTTGHSHIIAPFAEDGGSLVDALPQGPAAARFRAYWDLANRDWRNNSSGRPPYTLLDQVDYQGKLSSQLDGEHPAKVVYRKSGSWLESAVISGNLIADGTLYWYASADSGEAHYLSAIFNSRCLATFFNVAGRSSDRDFHTGPVRNLPIPAYDAGNARHANLAAQSQLAHRRVAALVAERQALRRRINRNDVLRDGALQPILASIDTSVRAILPAFSRLEPGGSAPEPTPAPTASDYLAIADREFEAGNAQQGVERLWDAVAHTLKSVAQERGWAIADADLYPVVERLAAMDEKVGEMLLSGFSSAEYYPYKVRYGYFDLDDGDDVEARRIIRNFIDRVKRLSNSDG